MSALPLPDSTCALAFALGISLALIAYWPVGWFSRWLGHQSRLDPRGPGEEGVPVIIVGTLERLFAFFLVLLHVEGAYTLLAFWLGAKLAASWHRLPTEPYTEADVEQQREYGRKVRAGTLCALIASIVSVLIGVLIGVGVRYACHCCVPA